MKFTNETSEVQDWGRYHGMTKALKQLMQSGYHDISLEYHKVSTGYLLYFRAKIADNDAILPGNEDIVLRFKLAPDGVIPQNIGNSYALISWPEETRNLVSIYLNTLVGKKVEEVAGEI